MAKIIVHLLWEGKFCSSFGSPPVVQVLIQQLGYIEIKAIPVKLEVSWIDTKVVIEFRKKTRKTTKGPWLHYWKILSKFPYPV